jgi:hypothetical protein
MCNTGAESAPDCSIFVRCEAAAAIVRDKHGYAIDVDENMGRAVAVYSLPSQSIELERVVFVLSDAEGYDSTFLNFADCVNVAGVAVQGQKCWNIQLCREEDMADFTDFAPVCDIDAFATTTVPRAGANSQLVSWAGSGRTQSIGQYSGCWKGTKESASNRHAIGVPASSRDGAFRNTLVSRRLRLLPIFL